jgi:hypothetical protein
MIVYLGKEKTMTELDKYKQEPYEISHDRLSSMSMTDTLELIDYIQKTSLAQVSVLKIHNLNLTKLAKIIKDSRE